MLSLLKKYKYIFIIILILVISAAMLLYRYNKPIPSQDSLSFKVNNLKNLEKPLTAAILLLTPTAGQFYVGDTIKVALLINVLGQPVNVVDGNITFPSDKLEVIDISKENSIVTLWIQEPIASSSKNSIISFCGRIACSWFYWNSRSNCNHVI